MFCYFFTPRNQKTFFLSLKKNTFCQTNKTKKITATATQTNIEDIYHFSYKLTYLKNMNHSLAQISSSTKQMEQHLIEIKKDSGLFQHRILNIIDKQYSEMQQFNETSRIIMFFICSQSFTSIIMIYYTIFHK